MALDPALCRQAAESHDPRFDGWIFIAVRTTGIYCRPSCPARPKPENLLFFSTAAAAHAAGYRACKRCRPDAAPGSPDWDRRGDVVGRAMRLIADGVVDRDGVPGLARRLGYTERHLHRQLVAVVGAGPLALARARRAQTARILLETTALPITEVAFAAGFQSVRQFNATIAQVFALAPKQLRERARRSGPDADGGGGIVLRLPYRAPLDADGLIAYLAMRAIPGIEEVDGGVYRRSLRLAHGAGIVELWPDAAHIQGRFRLDDLRDLGAAVQRSRVLLDLDADPQAVTEALGADPVLGDLVRAVPGRRVAGHVDGHELAIRAVLGQQVSLSAAVTHAARLVRTHGEPLAQPSGGVTHLFPAAAALAAMDPETLAMPRSRGRALIGLAQALADGELVLDAGSQRAQAVAGLLALPGVGPWTASYVAMRVLRDPDAFMPSDLGVRRALERLGLPGDPRSATRIGEGWRPYRAYALQHLWALVATPGVALAA